MNFIRIHVIPTANDDDSKKNTVTVDNITESINYANDVYKDAGITFVFDPQTDFDPIRQSTLLNQDMLEVPNAENYPPDNCPGNLELCNAEKDRIAKEYPGKLVLFCGEGWGYKYNNEKKKWEFQETGHWSNHINFFVRLVGERMPREKIPHEIGHYLHLPHTFREPGKYSPNTKEEAIELIREYVDVEGHPKEQGIDVFDGDLGYVDDTLPDPGMKLFNDAKLKPCDQQAVLTLTVPLKDGNQDYSVSPTYNIMSYWGGCPEELKHYITKGQIARIREALEKENRNHLIAPRVLYDAIWEPSNPGQTRVLGWALTDFAVRFDKELARQRSIKHMQAYDIGGGEIRWDGVWEPGNNGQTRALGWAFNDIAGRFKDEELAKGRHLVHMQAYDIGGGQIRWDAVWENGNTGQSWVLGWALADFAPKFDQELAKGRHLVHMQAYDIGGGQIRWDAVWENGDQGQTRAICWALNNFIDRFNQELANGKHLVHMQAYDNGGGEIRWDGVWEPGNNGQTRALGLGLGDFTVLLDNKLASNNRIVYMQAYLRK